MILISLSLCNECLGLGQAHAPRESCDKRNPIRRLNERGARATVKLPKISHEILAEMVGTTRPRITQFMNRFRKIGLLDYNGALTIRPDLLSDIVRRD
jgi:Crp-like helix-turn-helix domain